MTWVWLWATPTLAFQPPITAWPPESLPLAVEVPSSACPLGGDACLTAAETAADHWATVPCLGLVADVTGSKKAGGLDNGANELLFSDTLFVVQNVNLTNGDNDVSVYVLDNGTEVDFHTIDGMPLATHADVLAGECDEELDLLAFSTYALGKMFRLQDPSFNGPEGPYDFWNFGLCDPDAGILDPVVPNAFDFAPGIEIRCDPFGVVEGFVIPRVPLEVTCSVVPGPGVDALSMPYTDLEWDWGDGEVSHGLSASHTYTEGGVHQIVTHGFIDGEDCSVVRGKASAALTLCPLVEAELSTDEARGRTIHVRNAATQGPPGCSVDAAWTVHEGPTAIGPSLITSTSWSPFLSLPRSGIYTAQVTLTAEDGATATDAITFEVGGECGCRSTPGALWWWALVPLIGLRRRS